MPPRLLRLLWGLWFCMLALFVALVRYPVSTGLRRAACLVLLSLLWAGLLGLCWRLRIVRYGILALTGLIAGFLVWPAGGPLNAAELRAAYIEALRRYDGVPYVWGGENRRGIDCSGLIRRGLIDALVSSGLRTGNPGLVRSALALWWNDTTAKALGEGRDDLTVPLFEVPSINETESSHLQPGDLAVTRSGIHILAYLGEGQWIEADPQELQVLTCSVPSKVNWFQIPMRVVRWKILAP